MATSVKKASPATTTKPAAKKVVAAKAAESKPVAPAKMAEAATKPAVKRVSAAKTKLKASTAPTPVISSEQRNHYVSVAAFYIAERRGFTLGNPVDDWLAAEAEVDRLIASGHFPV